MELAKGLELSGWGRTTSKILSRAVDHSNKEMLKKHYLAQINTVKKCSGFRVFPNG